MNKLSYVTTLAYVKALSAVDTVKENAAKSVKEFNSDERGVEGFVVALILIGIAALLAVAFKDAISDIMQSLIDSIKDMLGLS